jgi:hypothetical protein
MRSDGKSSIHPETSFSGASGSYFMPSNLSPTLLSPLKPILYHISHKPLFEHSSDWQSCHQTAGTSSTSPDRAVAQAQPAVQQQLRSYHRRSDYLPRLQREDWQSTVDRIQFLGAEDFPPFGRASRGRATTTARVIIIGTFEFYISFA